eukprot:SAG31_NODE_2071_length_6515_cov_2.490804_2_plen_49_part_00
MLGVASGRQIAIVLSLFVGAVGYIIQGETAIDGDWQLLRQQSLCMLLL